MRKDVDATLDALLAQVGPAVPGHPLPLALGALVLPEAPLLPLVRRQAFPLGPRLYHKNKIVRRKNTQV